MATALFILLSFGLALAVTWGQRRNRERATFFLRVLEEQFTPQTTDYAVLGRGLGFGFDYTLSGPIQEMQGVLTLLPRYTPLYLPIARMIGRQDLLKLTFHCKELLPPGVAALVHTNCTVSRWSAVEHDEDWREESVRHDGQEYTLYYFNPIIADRLRSFLPLISSVKDLNQIAVDSRRGVITIFVTPEPNTIREELKKLVEIVFSLTGR